MTMTFTTFDDIGYVPRYESRPCAVFVTVPAAVPRYKSATRVPFVTLPTVPQFGSSNWHRQQTGHATGCVMCGAPVARWCRMTCGSACRQRAYRLRKSSRGD